LCADGGTHSNPRCEPCSRLRPTPGESGRRGNLPRHRHRVSRRTRRDRRRGSPHRPQRRGPPPGAHAHVRRPALDRRRTT
jgi:hypothetical protein